MDEAERFRVFTLVHKEPTNAADEWLADKRRIVALEAQLAALREQEPVAWLVEHDDFPAEVELFDELDHAPETIEKEEAMGWRLTPLYKAQPAIPEGWLKVSEHEPPYGEHILIALKLAGGDWFTCYGFVQSDWSLMSVDDEPIGYDLDDDAYWRRSKPPIDTPRPTLEAMTGACDELFQLGWNACRDAMLAAQQGGT
jgi:hypothetical protein